MKKLLRMWITRDAHDLFSGVDVWSKEPVRGDDGSFISFNRFAHHLGELDESFGLKQGEIREFRLVPVGRGKRGKQ